ncbi:MAG: type II toxin-antitoxin system MqsA family antitoxin [Zoogloeaceae bacterium]|nr:type II toxin-antitoxin system MqsA family antitoxin [Zoogloeaceae bacterium]MCK6383828.1 type II toxin-antitoxin system MqsA family antitoxin [Rhodocyclaceae bacterium]
MCKAGNHPCLNCEQSDMELRTKDVTIELDGLSRVVPGVKGWHCPACGDIEFVGNGSAKRYAAALDALAAERDARQRDELARIRKRLKLTQAQAAAIADGGPNAFSRYERGKARPVAAVVNLFRLLDKHPELLAELRSAG